MGQSKNASGVTVYLQEELGNARLCLAQLTRYVADGIQLIDRSSHRDHFYEVAGHLIEKAPEALARLQASLSAVALAADRVDYEELKMDLHPNKVVELERVLEENRLRHVRRRGVPTMLTPTTVAKTLRELAAKTRDAGAVPISDLVGLVSDLEQGRKTARSVESAADLFESSAETLENAGKGEASRVQLAAVLRGVLGDYITASADIPNERAVQRILDDIEIDAQAMQGQGAPEFIESGLEAVEKHVAKAKKLLGLRMASGKGADGEKEGRFEEGKPADPTKNMSPEDKKKWEENVDHDGSNIKKAAAMAGGVTASTDKEAGLESPIKEALKKAYEAGLKATGLSMSEVDNEIADAEREVVRAIHKIVGDADDKSIVAREGQNLYPALWELFYYVGALQSPSLEGRTAAQREAAQQEAQSKIASYQSGREAKADDKEGKFEEGKPADPTKNMSPEDKKKWDESHEKNKDRFKKAVEEESGPVRRALLKAMLFAEKEGAQLVERVRKGEITDVYDELDYALEVMRAKSDALSATARVVKQYGEGKGHLKHLEKLVKDFSDEAIEAFGWMAYVRGIGSNATEDELRGLEVKLAGREKEAAASSIKIKGRGDDLTIEEGYDGPDPINRRGALQLIASRLKRDSRLVVLTDQYSLGPSQVAAGPGFRFAVLDKQGAPVVQGDDAAKMWSLYGPAMIDGKKIRPVKMVEAADDKTAKDYGRGDDNGWGGADPWPGTGKEAGDKAAKAKPSAANLMLAAGSFADKAFSVKKERAPYPRKWYRELEQMFGPLPAVALKYFDDAFEHHFNQLEQGRALLPPPIPSGLDKTAGRLVDTIEPGDMVTIVTPQGKKMRGRATMRSRSIDGWVLNMGGRFGKPGIATDDNVVKVTKGRRASEDDRWKA